MNTKVKICGITEPESLRVTIESGADFIGFVFYDPSTRNITPQNAAPLIASIPSHIASVALFVNPTDEQLEMTLSVARTDYIQLHGSEDPTRVKTIKSRFNIPVIKAIGIASEEDIALARTYEDTADWLLFDTKSPNHGGTGQSFDWALLQNKSFTKPVMLSGGLHADNVKDAMRQVSPNGIDVSSGVESSPGIKDVLKITNFIKEVKSNG